MIEQRMYVVFQGLSWSWSHGRWIYNYLCKQRLSPLKLWVRIPLMATLCDKIWQWLAVVRWFSPCTPVSSTDKPDLPRYNLNIVESCVKHNNPNSNPMLFFDESWFTFFHSGCCECIEDNKKDKFGSGSVMVVERYIKCAQIQRHNCSHRNYQFHV